MNLTFLYFAFGSNLLQTRIQENNPSATRTGVGILKTYRLDFGNFSERWDGAVATVVPDNNSCVWGALWEINNAEMASLDEQEGVPEGKYEVVPDAQIVMENGEVVTCRTYQLAEHPPALKDRECLPNERHPSDLYMYTIIKGAKESRLPFDYIHHLKMFKLDGYCDPAYHNCGTANTVEKI